MQGCRKGDTTQHAAAALQQSNRRQGSPSIDADVAAEAALMQARCTAWISSQQAPPRGETHKTSSSAVLPEATTEALINPDRTAVTVSKSSRTTHADEADSTCNSSSSTAVVETINLAAVNSVPAAATANAESTAVITESTAAHAALVTHAVRPTDVLMTPPDAASFDNNRCDQTHCPAVLRNVVHVAKVMAGSSSGLGFM